MPGLEDFLMQVGGQAAGTGMGLLLADENDRRQLRQQEKLQKLGIKGSKEMTDYSYKKQLEMWKDTNYGAQMEELAKAGLNPGLLYGMGGQGGMTAGSGASSVESGKAPQGGGEAQGMGLVGAQMGLLAAQTEKTKAETQNITGQAANQPIIGENITAQTENTRLDSEIKQIAASVSRQTINEQMASWENLIKKQEAEIKAQGLANKLNEAQLDDKVKMMKLQVGTEALKQGLIKAETANVSEDTKKKASEIINNEQIRQNLVQKLWMDRDYLSNEKLKTLMQSDANFQNWSDSELDVIVPIIGSIRDLFWSKPSAKPITGFHKR